MEELEKISFKKSMGVPLLWKLFYSQGYNPPNKSLKDFKGKRIAIDAAKLFYDGLNACREKNSYGYLVPLCSEDGPLIAHVVYFGNFLLKLQEAGVRPLFVFEPQESLEQKEKTKEKRDFRSIKAKENLKNFEEKGFPPQKKVVQNLYIQSYRRNSFYDHQFKVLLDELGVKYIQTPELKETDCYLAALYKQGHCDAVMTYDSDLLVHGVDKIVRTDVRYNSMDEFCFQDALNAARMSKEEVFELGLLFGNDYSDGIVNKARLTRAHFILVNLIRKYKTVEETYIKIKETPSLRGYFPNVRRGTLSKSSKAREIFMSSDNVDLFVYNDVIRSTNNYLRFSEEKLRQSMEAICRCPIIIRNGRYCKANKDRRKDKTVQVQSPTPDEGYDWIH